MQIYQNHVVFRSFSDLYTVEQMTQARVQRQQEAQAAKTAASRAAAAASQSSSTSSTPYSSRAPSLVESSTSPLSRTSTNSSNESVATQPDVVASPQTEAGAVYYPNGLFNSSVERRLKDREADIATLADEPLLHAAAHDLSLRRF